MDLYLGGSRNRVPGKVSGMTESRRQVVDCCGLAHL